MVERPLPPASQSGSKGYAANAQTTATAAYGLKNPINGDKYIHKRDIYPHQEAAMGTLPESWQTVAG